MVSGMKMRVAGVVVGVVTLVAGGVVIAGTRAAASTRPAGRVASTQATTRPSTRPAVQVRARRVYVRITGTVQGVGFRDFTLRQARALGLKGYVLNRVDGSVEAVVEGGAPQVARMVAALKRGPQGARVDGITVVDQPYRGEFEDFTVRWKVPN